jgi:tRNA pseudouridine38-40 synthase
MTNYKASVQYDGTDYYGFQSQAEQPTIQRVLENVLAEITREPVRVVGAGRTDRGVHARVQVISFQSDWVRSPEVMQRACNAQLPTAISIQSLAVAPEEFHARRSARARTYRYTLDNRVVRAPLASRYAWHVHGALAEDTMQAALHFCLGRHDFVAFGSPPKKDKSGERDLLSARCWRELDWVFVELKANAFLQGMARRIVGTLVEVGAGRLDPGRMAELLAERDKQQVKWKAPPHGLCLWDVNY